MYRPEPLVVNETYHIYNRGAHKQDIFTCEWDYGRFMLLLYLANNSNAVHLSNLLSSPKYQGESLLKIFQDDIADKSLVDIFAFCLMPNHFHLIVRPKKDVGLPMFMRKLLTAYSMYFNTKYEHSGVLFQGPYKSKHVGNEAYFRYVYSYVHLNPIDFVESNWKKGRIEKPEEVRKFLNNYAYSSFYDYAVGNRPERIILNCKDAPPFLTEMNDLEELLKWHSIQQGESLLGVGIK